MDLRLDEKRSKKKRRFPLFDIALLVLLALAICGGIYWATHRAETPTVELTYTVRFSGVDNAYSGTLSAGKTLYTVAGDEMGKIQSASASRALESRFDGSAVTGDESEQYRYIQTRSTDKSDVVVTVLVTAEARDGGYFVEGRRIAAGMEVSAMVSGYLGTGLILTVEPLPATEGAA